MFLTASPTTKKYKTAKEIMKKILFEISEETKYNDIIDLNLVNIPAHIVNKVREKENTKKWRQKAFDQIDWQRERLPSLARKVNVNFVRENRSVIKKSFLMDKLKFLSYDSIVRLVKLSNGWLKFARKDHIKRNNMTDLNFVYNKILKY